MFLEVHQPVGQLQRVDIEQYAVVAECAGIFPVRIDQHHVAIGGRFQHLVQQGGHRCRLADAGRAQHGEMLAEQRIEIEFGLQILGRMNDAQRNRRDSVRPEDLRPVLDRGLELLGIHRDQVLMQVEAPLRHGAQLHGEPEERQHGIAGHVEALAVIALDGGGREHAIVALEARHLAELEAHLAPLDQLAHLLHRVGRGAELVAAMQQRQALRDRLQVDRPVERGVATTHDQHVPAAQRFHLLDRIEHRGVLVGVDSRDRRLLGLEGSAARRDHHHLGAELQAAVGLDFEVGVTELLHARHHVVEVKFRVERLDLFEQPRGKFGTRHDGQCRNVVDRLFRVELGTLAARPVEDVDDVAADVEQTQLEHGEEAAGTGADDDGIRGDHIRHGAQPSVLQNCFSGTLTRRPSSASDTLIWQERRELSRTSNAKSSMSSSIGLRAPTFATQSGSM